MRAKTISAVLLTAATGLALAGPASAAQAATSTPKECKMTVTSHAGEDADPHFGGVGMGSPGYQKDYSWKVGGRGGQVQILLRGFDDKGKEIWVHAGIFNSGYGASALVPWGNVAATAGVMAVTLNGLHDVPVDFKLC